LLARPRDQFPDAQSLIVLLDTLHKQLDRQLSAIEGLDRKASLLLGAILGLGVLNADRLAAPPMPALLVFSGALIFSLLAVVASLIVLWSRRLLTGPKPISSAQATGWKELHFRQSVADSLAIAVEENTGVNDFKGWWLNFAFTAATIAVIAFAILGVVGRGMTGDNQTNAQPTQTATPTAPASKPPSPEPTASEQPSQTATPSEPAFVHPWLGVASMSKASDPDIVPPPPSPDAGERHD
jgi:hypothetical protein